MEGTRAARLTAAMLLLGAVFGAQLVPSVLATVASRRTVAEVQRDYGHFADARFRPVCEKQSVAWPPSEVTLLVFKEEQRLEVWARARDRSMRAIGAYAMTATSGKLGPKRRQGDRQIPEGFYAVDGLNPNSAYHLSMRVNYPNGTDRRHRATDVDDLGGDIFIHGNAVTIGCVPIGDQGISELFPLIAQVPTGKRRVLICPVDFRRRPGFRLAGESAWVDQLYAELEAALKDFPLAP